MRPVVLGLLCAGAIGVGLWMTSPRTPATIMVGVDPYVAIANAYFSAPVEVTGTVVLRSSVEGREFADRVIELDHAVNFQAQTYSVAILDSYNDHIMFEIEAAISHRITTRCRFAKWLKGMLLCAPDEIEIMR